MASGTSKEVLTRELTWCSGAKFLNGEIFYSLKEVQVLAEQKRIHHNVRLHSSSGYKPAHETATI